MPKSLHLQISSGIKRVVYGWMRLPLIQFLHHEPDIMILDGKIALRLIYLALYGVLAMLAV